MTRSNTFAVSEPHGVRSPRSGSQLIAAAVDRRAEMETRRDARLLDDRLAALLAKADDLKARIGKTMVQDAAKAMHLLSILSRVQQDLASVADQIAARENISVSEANGWISQFSDLGRRLTKQERLKKVREGMIALSDPLRITAPIEQEHKPWKLRPTVVEKKLKNGQRIKYTLNDPQYEKKYD